MTEIACGRLRVGALHPAVVRSLSILPATFPEKVSTYSTMADPNQNAHNSDLTLVDGLKRRDAEAYAAMVRRFSGLVLHKARVMLGDRAGAEDVAQEVFVKAWREMHNLRGTHVAAWLAAITYRQCLDAIRYQRRRPRTVPILERDAGGVSGPEALLDGSGEELLQTLNPTERAVVFLRVVEHYDYAEIAQITGLAQGSLRNMVSSCLRRLRAEHGAAPAEPTETSQDEGGR